MDDLKYQIGQRISLTESDEEGYVVGRAEYENAEPSYYVRYRAADGRQSECWWSESALRAAG